MYSTKQQVLIDQLTYCTYLASLLKSAEKPNNTLAGLLSDLKPPQGLGDPIPAAVAVVPLPAKEKRPESKLERSTKKTKRKADQLESSTAPVTQKPDAVLTTPSTAAPAVRFLGIAFLFQSSEEENGPFQSNMLLKPSRVYRSQ